jgi:cell filamentation protein
MARYEPKGVEAEFEPGSRGRVLRNKLGITRVSDINLAESQALALVQQEAIEAYSEDHRFTELDVRELHHSWLGEIYDWAGEYRQLNMAKEGFQFANARLIPELMKKFGGKYLARYTPCRVGSDDAIAEVLAVVHAELVLIHPFREGNGRLARLLSLLMGLQAGLPPLDFSAMSGRGRRKYIAGIQTAMSNDYRVLKEVFLRVIDRTRKAVFSSSR